MCFSNNSVLTWNAPARLAEQHLATIHRDPLTVHSRRLYKYGAKLGPFPKNRRNSCDRVHDPPQGRLPESRCDRLPPLPRSLRVMCQIAAIAIQTQIYKIFVHELLVAFRSAALHALAPVSTIERPGRHSWPLVMNCRFCLAVVALLLRRSGIYRCQLAPQCQSDRQDLLDLRLPYTDDLQRIGLPHLL